MIGNQQETGFANPPCQYHDAGMQALLQASTRLKTMRPGNSRFRTRDLVGLLLSHGARTWRNTQPLVHIRLKAAAPDGTDAIRLKFQNQTF